LLLPERTSPQCSDSYIFISGNSPHLNNSKSIKYCQNKNPRQWFGRLTTSFRAVALLPLYYIRKAGRARPSGSRSCSGAILRAEFPYPDIRTVFLPLPAFLQDKRNNNVRVYSFMRFVKNNKNPRKTLRLQPPPATMPALSLSKG